MSVVISDTSPLRALHHLKMLSLLPTIFQNVIVPTAVMRELEAPNGRYLPIARTEIPFVLVASPRLIPLSLKEHPDLDIGEIEAIALAMELRPQHLLMDERAGRVVAKELGIAVMGILGLLSEAKSRGYLPTVRPAMDDLRDNLRFFISHELYEYVLKQNGEL